MHSPSLATHHRRLWSLVDIPNGDATYDSVGFVVAMYDQVLSWVLLDEILHALGLGNACFG